MADPSMPDVPDDDAFEGLPTAEQVESWPTALAVASQFGKSTQWVGQMVRQGHLHPFQDAKGYRHFSPDEVEALLPNGAAVAIQNQDGTFRILSDNAKVLAANNAELLKILPGPMKALLDQQATMIGQLFDRIRELETERRTMLEKQEAVETTLHQRRLERLKTKREQKRLDDALRNISDALPRFLEQLLIGRDVSSLIQSLDPTLLEALTADDVPLLNPEQKARIKSIAAKLTDRQAKKSNGSVAKELPPADPTAPAPAPDKVEVVA